MLSDEDRESFLAIVDANANQLQDEILQIFQYLEAITQAKHSQSRCSVAEVEAIISQITANLELTSIKLSYQNLADPADAYLPTSRQTMELILWELCENAKKFHPRQTPALGVNMSGIPAGLRLQLSDDGVTLAPDQLAHMWTPYYQGEKYFTGQMPGMGLGLAMVAQLVWGMGGACRAYNREDGPGIVVELELPLAE
jgi:K+-sensing histidine kinase KdpD